MSDQWITLAHAVSRLLGWSYFLCWGISFYPQLIINYRRKSVTGLALDYFTINVLGFACYTVSSFLFLFSPVVRDEYARRHPNAPEPTVRWNDLAFAVHAMLISIITWSQFFLWGYQRHPQQKLSKPMAIIIIGCIAAIIFSTLSVDGKSWQWIDVVYILAYIKLLISIIKYLPQAFLNYQRKSTIGWSIHNILLDISGGILSLAQLILDSSLQSDWSGLTGNPIKFFLSQIAIGFDLVFMFQHYILYRGRESDNQAERGGSERRGRWRTGSDDEEEALRVEGAEANERRALLSEAAAETVAGNPSEISTRSEIV
ncbi:PQ loop repeat-domain-containing protein [Trichophaea hybrida]|nr:PQ loop repeat-domain-containing protein [Trichophaea hybrida]